MTKMLNTADPTMVPTPSAPDVVEFTSDKKLTKSSGADDPAAIKVAPA